MDVEDAIFSRRSVRSYTDESVSRDDIKKIFNSVKMAPTTHKLQNQRFVIVEKDDVKKELYRAANQQKFVKNAPIVIVGVTKTPLTVLSSGIRAGVLDMAIAMDHLSLKAAEEGLGTCWIGGFIQEKVKKAINIPEEFEVVAMMTLGYPEEPLEKKDGKKLSLDELISYNKFPE